MMNITRMPSGVIKTNMSDFVIDTSQYTNTYGMSVWDRLYAYNESAVRYCHARCTEVMKVEINNFIVYSFVVLILVNIGEYYLFNRVHPKAKKKVFVSMCIINVMIGIINIVAMNRF